MIGDICFVVVKMLLVLRDDDFLVFCLDSIFVKCFVCEIVLDLWCVQVDFVNVCFIVGVFFGLVSFGCVRFVLLL